MGKLIVFEGTDGSGKSTQFDLLTKRLEREGQAFRRLRFPRYDQESSALIRMYLGGQFGSDPNAVNAYAASTFYAVDRYASYLQDWKDDYKAGMLFLADRYTTSNAVHQGGKMDAEARAAYYDWLYDLEFGKMGLPKPDLVILMDMPIELTRQLMRKRVSMSRIWNIWPTAGTARWKRRSTTAGPWSAARKTENSEPLKRSTRKCTESWSHV